MDAVAFWEERGGGHWQARPEQGLYATAVKKEGREGGEWGGGGGRIRREEAEEKEETEEVRDWFA